MSGRTYPHTRDTGETSKYWLFFTEPILMEEWKTFLPWLQGFIDWLSIWSPILQLMVWVPTSIQELASSSLSKVANITMYHCWCLLSVTAPTEAVNQVDHFLDFMLFCGNVCLPFLCFWVYIPGWSPDLFGKTDCDSLLLVIRVSAQLGLVRNKGSKCCFLLTPTARNHWEFVVFVSLLWPCVSWSILAMIGQLWIRIVLHRAGWLTLASSHPHWPIHCW